MFLFQALPSPETVRTIAGFNTEQLLVFAIIILATAGSGIIIYLLRREDRFRDQLIDSSKLVIHAVEEKKDFDGLLVELRKHITDSAQGFAVYTPLMERLVQQMEATNTLLATVKDHLSRRES